MIRMFVATLLTTSMGAAMAQDDVIAKAAAEKARSRPTPAWCISRLPEAKVPARRQPTSPVHYKGTFPDGKESTLL